MSYYNLKKEELLMKNIQEVWDAIMVVLKNDPTLSDAVYAAWFTCIKPVAIEGDSLILSVEGSLQKQMIEKFSVNLEAAIEATVGFPLQPVIRAEEEEQAKAEDARHDAEAEVRKDAAIREIVKLENLEASKEEIGEAVALICRQNGMTVEELKPYYDAQFEQAVIKSVLTGKVMGLIRDAADVTVV